MDLGLSGKIALVTAASKGIGRGIATVLAQEGADVIILSRNKGNLLEAQRIIKRETGVKIDIVEADLTKRELVTKAVSEIKGRYGGVDILVFNTGGPRPGYFSDLEMKDWIDAVDILLYPAIQLTKEFIDSMVEKRWGRIIYSTSIAIKEPIDGLVLSNAVRLSMAGLVRSLAREYGAYGVTVNAVMPGYIKTERVMQLARDRAKREEKDVEEVLSELTRDIPSKRMADPLEVGYLVAFLSSDKAAYINGAVIPIDGGYLRSAL
jgi:3-oxoacyl-[acyl-carrier protein] reductase